MITKIIMIQKVITVILTIMIIILKVLGLIILIKAVIENMLYSLKLFSKLAFYNHL